MQAQPQQPYQVVNNSDGSGGLYDLANHITDPDLQVCEMCSLQTGTLLFG
jgi:hypothetical protein